VGLTIVQAGDPVLRQLARPLQAGEITGSEIQDLIRRMQKAMYDAPGVGLAAPQVGIPVQLAVIEDRADYHKEISPAQLAERERRPVPFQVIVNPTITSTPAIGNAVEFYEGCLSLAGFTALVPRQRTLRVECLDERGKPKVIEASGWYARILQHEIDHLHGVLYIDRMRSRTFGSVENWKRFWKDKPIEEIRSELNAQASL
jgi:peptide deformylase